MIYLSLYILVIINNLVFLNHALSTIYIPQQVPNEFFEVNKILGEDTQLFNTVWYPGITKPYWSKTREIEYVFTNQISAKPAITNKSDRASLVNYLFNSENIYTIDLGKTLNLLGVKYVIFRNDENIFEKEHYKSILDHREDLEKVYQGDILTMYKNKEYVDLARIYTQKVISNKGLEVFKDLSILDNHSFIEVADKTSNIQIPLKGLIAENGEYADIAINNYINKFVYPAEYSNFQETGNSGQWAFGSLENLSHAETDFFFHNAGINVTQLDYKNKVLSSWDGYQLVTDVATKNDDKIKLFFNKHPNVSFSNENGNMYYKANENDFKYIWNTIESDKFDVAGITALQIEALTKMSPELEPHIKIQTFTATGEKIDVEILYPKERGHIEGIIKIDNIAKYATLKIFTKSTPGNLYSYKIEALKISNVSNNVENTNLTINIDNNYCKKECYPLVRVLKSELGGLLNININDYSFSVDTRVQRDQKDRYIWLNLGEVKELPNKINIKLVNSEGFNSINTMTILTKEEYIQLKSYENYLKSINAITLPTLDSEASVTIDKINPTKYSINIDKDIKSQAVISLAMPYNQNWELSGNPSKIINGYINGWEVENLKKGTYLIEFKPQKYFYIGTVISLSTGVILGIFLGVYHFLNKSVRESKTQG